MKKEISELIKKTGIFRIALLAAAAAVLVVCSIPVPEKSKSSSNYDIEKETQEQENTEFAYEERLEERVKKIISSMKGIKSADVMITLSSSKEMILEKNVEMKEEKASQESSVIEKKTSVLLIEPDEKSMVPYVIKEISPKVCGVVVAVQGNITSSTIKEISEAVQALFDIEAHKIKVIEKK